MDVTTEAGNNTMLLQHPHMPGAVPRRRGRDTRVHDADRQQWPRCVSRPARAFTILKLEALSSTGVEIQKKYMGITIEYRATLSIGTFLTIVKS